MHFEGMTYPIIVRKMLDLALSHVGGRALVLLVEVVR